MSAFDDLNIGHRDDKPHTRLTRVLHTAIRTIEDCDEHEDGDRFIMLAASPSEAGEGIDGGFITGGFESEEQMLEDLFTHMRAVLEAFGYAMKIEPVARVPRGADLN